MSAIWLREKLFPTTTPTTVPMSAPATKSENQWMVMETPISIRPLKHSMILRGSVEKNSFICIVAV